jgi:hypothetical protein
VVDVRRNRSQPKYSEQREGKGVCWVAMITIADLPSLSEAYVLKSLLDVEGIEVFIPDEVSRLPRRMPNERSRSPRAFLEPRFTICSLVECSGGIEHDHQVHHR